MGIRRKASATVAALSVGIALTIAGPSEWTPFALAASCTPSSATYSQDGVNYQVLVFTNASSCDWSVPEGVTEVDLLVIGGGGAGGGLGGGGAGEFVQRTSLAVSGVISVEVGSGGPADDSSSESVRNGQPSTFGSITAAGGGGGGLGNGGDGADGIGGASGGGAARNDGDPGLTINDFDSDSFGNDGVTGYGRRNPTVGGGGGGAGADARAVTLSYPAPTSANYVNSLYYDYLTDPDNVSPSVNSAGVSAPGGDGKSSAIISIDIANTLQVGEVSGGAVYFSGGGAGGCGGDSGARSGCGGADLSGGVGGGGDGNGGSGTSGTGGGGAGSSGIGSAGGAGGSGVVIVRYVLIDSDDSASGSSSPGDSKAGAPGIFLTVQARLGSPVAGSTVVCGSFSVRSNSPYVLMLEPRDGRFPPRVLARGFVNSGGHLEREVSLPALAPGSYDLVFSGQATTGAELRLTNVIVVAEGGVTVSKTSENLQPVVRS